MPFVMEFSTKPLLNDTFFLGQTQPGFLAEREMGRHDVLQGTRSAILAIFFARHAYTIDNIVDRWFVSWIVRHLVVHTMVRFYVLARMKHVVIIRNDSLKGHGSVKYSCFSTPSTELGQRQHMTIWMISLICAPQVQVG